MVILKITARLEWLGVFGFVFFKCNFKHNTRMAKMELKHFLINFKTFLCSFSKLRKMIYKISKEFLR